MCLTCFRENRMKGTTIRKNAKYHLKFKMNKPMTVILLGNRDIDRVKQVTIKSYWSYWSYWIILWALIQLLVFL